PWTAFSRTLRRHRPAARQMITAASRPVSRMAGHGMAEQTPEPSGSVASGGPMDGRRPGEPDAAEFEVVTADQTRHVYRSTRKVRPGDDGSLCRVFVCSGPARPT
ncbi:hypothetical protein, partial [Frankia nepalensis]